MVRKILTVACMVAFMMVSIVGFTVLFCGCGSTHNITIASGGELLSYCPIKAQTGEVVTVRTRDIQGSSVDIWVNDEDSGKYTDKITYRFEMPDSDVVIEAKAKDKM